MGVCAFRARFKNRRYRVIKGGGRLEKTKNGITEGVIWKQLLLFFFPILIGTFFQQLYNTVDTIIVGQFVGTEALAAVGTTGTVINLLVGFFVGVASGATVIISQYFGANDRENLSKSVHTSMALAVAGCHYGHRHCDGAPDNAGDGCAGRHHG